MYALMLLLQILVTEGLLLIKQWNYVGYNIIIKQGGKGSKNDNIIHKYCEVLNQLVGLFDCPLKGR